VLARHGGHDASEAAAHGSAQTPTSLVFAPSVTRESPSPLTACSNPILGIKGYKSVQFSRGWPFFV
jgi:hypothetical protein